jgi:hypothetical protein
LRLSCLLENVLELLLGWFGKGVLLTQGENNRRIKAER